MVNGSFSIAPWGVMETPTGYFKLTSMVFHPVGKDMSARKKSRVKTSSQRPQFQSNSSHCQCAMSKSIKSRQGWLLCHSDSPNMKPILQVKTPRDTWLWNCCRAGLCPTETYPASRSWGWQIWCSMGELQRKTHPEFSPIKCGVFMGKFVLFHLIWIYHDLSIWHIYKYNAENIPRHSSFRGVSAGSRPKHNRSEITNVRDCGCYLSKTVVLQVGIWTYRVHLVFVGKFSAWW